MRQVIGLFLWSLFLTLPAAHADDPKESWSEGSALSPLGIDASVRGNEASQVSQDVMQETPVLGAGSASAEQDLRDPFQSTVGANAPDPLAGVANSSATPVKAILTGIGRDAQDSFAIINSEVYREGEVKAGIKIVQIRKKEVDIETGGVAQKLVLLPKGEMEQTLARIKKKTNQEGNPASSRGAAQGQEAGSLPETSGLPQDGSLESYE